MHRKLFKLLITILILLIFSQLRTKEAKASITEDIDYTEIQKVIDEVMDTGEDFNFNSYIDSLMNGEEMFSINSIGNHLLISVIGEVKANLGTFGKLFMIAIIAAVFTNFTMAFKDNQISETGFYITYLLLFVLLISSFVVTSKIAVDTVYGILDFMKVLMPAYFLAVGFCTGSTTSVVFYEGALMLITIIDIILVKVIIPLINFYLIVELANNLYHEDMLSKLSHLFALAVRWILKSLLAAVVGFHLIQGLIVPVIDQVKRSVLYKATEAIPGVGDVLGGVTQTILGAGVLLKNSIGVGGLIVIITICAVPFLKLLVITVIYKIGCAALQPISDKRFISCVNATANSTGMLLRVVLVGGVSFILAITIVAMTTRGV